MFPNVIYMNMQNLYKFTIQEKKPFEHRGTCDVQTVLSYLTNIVSRWIQIENKGAAEGFS